MTEDKMVGWLHQLNGLEFEETLGDSEGQGSLVCCSSQGYRVGHDLGTEQQQTYFLSNMNFYREGVLYLAQCIYHPHLLC